MRNTVTSTLPWRIVIRQGKPDRRDKKPALHSRSETELSNTAPPFCFPLGFRVGTKGLLQQLIGKPDDFGGDPLPLPLNDAVVGWVSRAHENDAHGSGKNTDKHSRRGG